MTRTALDQLIYAASDAHAILRAVADNYTGPRWLLEAIEGSLEALDHAIAEAKGVPHASG